MITDYTGRRRQSQKDTSRAHPARFNEKMLSTLLRYMPYYCMGLVGHELEFAVKKYKTHRPIDAELDG